MTNINAIKQKELGQAPSTKMGKWGCPLLSCETKPIQCTSPQLPTWTRFALSKENLSISIEIMDAAGPLLPTSPSEETAQHSPEPGAARRAERVRKV